MVALVPYLPAPPSGGVAGPGNAPLELLALELSLLLSPLPPPRNSRSCRFVNRFQNDSRLAFCLFMVASPSTRMSNVDLRTAKCSSLSSP